MTGPKTLIFVPTYNERDNAERMAAELLALPLEADILFMDDGSPDGTGDILDVIASREPRLTVLHRHGKLGIGSAHVDGIRWAYDREYELLVTLDCDFTHKPSDVMRLLEFAEQFDVTTGSRYLAPGSLPGWNMLRRSLTGLGHVLTKHLLGIQFDATGALRSYDLRRIPRELFDLVRAKGYGFFFESMFLLVRNGHSVKELPIVLPARTYGSSKMTPRETLRSGRRLLALWKESVLNPDRFRVMRHEIILDPTLTDPQGWDNYWEMKTKPATRAYEMIASIYRISVIRSQLRRALARTYERGSSLLHAGCGSGQVDQGMHGRFSITAVDISPPALNLYARNNPDARAIRHASILSLPFPDASFDGVYNLGVLEHFTRSEIAAVLTEFRRVLKPDGRLLIFWPHSRATSVAVLGAAHWVMEKTGDEATRLHPPEVSLLKSKRWVEQLLRDSGLRLVHYAFGPRDFFVQAVLTAEKA
jgi:dolichol-phosphate mannosyltransferase